MRPDAEVLDRMRRDWNDRAREDANYYVAFGRRGQDDAEFFASAADVMRAMREELRRLPPNERRAALEIGCGPGRLLRPASALFHEIHGVDVSDEMVRLAAEKLRDLPNAHVHASSGSDLAMFADARFDFVYSYAVFQHIPSREVVLQYLREARRVLRTGGILWCQLNGLPRGAAPYNTWEGVRISAAEFADFARDYDFQLLRLEGIDTQYMWITCRKQRDGWSAGLQHAAHTTSAHIRKITDAYSDGGATPAAGRFAVAALSMENLPADCDLNHLQIRIDGARGRPAYIGPALWDGVRQVNVVLPENLRTGLVPVEVMWLQEPLCPPAWMRIIPPGPLVPQVRALTDGVDLLAGARIRSGIVKATLEEVPRPEEFRAAVNGQPVEQVDHFCIDPSTRSFEFNFHLPRSTKPGPNQVEIWLGRRPVASIAIEVG